MALLAPGLWLQRLTTREPSLDQLEVSISALKDVLRLEGRHHIRGAQGRGHGLVARGNPWFPRDPLLAGGGWLDAFQEPASASWVFERSPLVVGLPPGKARLRRQLEATRDADDGWERCRHGGRFRLAVVLVARRARLFREPLDEEAGDQ